MASASIICRIDKKSANGQSPIYIRLIHQRKIKYLATKINVYPEKHWDEVSNQIKKSHPNSVRVNSYLQVLYGKVFEVALALNDKKIKWNEVNLSNLNSGTLSTDFIEFGRGLVEQLKTKNQIRTQKRYNTILNKLSAFNNSKPLLFEEINVGFLGKYETYLSSIGNRKNTIHTNLKTIRAILYEAIRQGLVEQKDNPFFQFKLKLEKPIRTRLTIEEVTLLEALPDDKLTLNQKVVRDAFLFSLYCAGIRAGDILQLTPKNILGNTLSYTMDKTGNPRLLAIIDKGMQIILKYNTNNKKEPIFPLLKASDLELDIAKRLQRIGSLNSIMNKHLKSIAKLSGVDKPLTFHMARHGWSEIARKKNIDVYKISKALGHRSISITESYLNTFDIDSMEDTMNQVFD